MINDIGPPIALTLKIIIVSPLILSYKYEKLKEERGLEKACKETERIEWGELSRVKREAISLSLYAENDPK